MTFSSGALKRCETHFRSYEAREISPELLSACAALFSSHYGIWSPVVGRPLRPGSRIRMSMTSLRERIFQDPMHTLLATCSINGTLVAHAFACAWKYQASDVLWITQLVVSSHFRRRAIATTLISLLLDHPSYTFDFAGIASSHPAACLALTKAAQKHVNTLDLSFIKTHARGILDSSPVSYLVCSTLKGTLFNDPGSGECTSSEKHDTTRTSSKFGSVEDSKTPCDKIEELQVPIPSLLPALATEGDLNSDPSSTSPTCSSSESSSPLPPASLPSSASPTPPTTSIPNDTPASPQVPAICSAFTHFYVDHSEPLAAQHEWEQTMGRPWPLGRLEEGCEFLVILPLAGRK